jgi:hypothetical protein
LLQITEERDRTVVVMYEFIKKHVHPFQAEAPRVIGHTNRELGMLWYKPEATCFEVLWSQVRFHGKHEVGKE